MILSAYSLKRAATGFRQFREFQAQLAQLQGLLVERPQLPFFCLVNDGRNTDARRVGTPLLALAVPTAEDNAEDCIRSA
jgi:hypothetical protein